MSDHDSQREHIRRHLLTRGTITPLEALHDYGCLRLGGRIMELRRAGMPIETRYRPEGKRYAVYTYTGKAQLSLFAEAAA